ncbi:MAG: DUF1643 domain-containing protein [Ruminococcaceae bacterium]|nr:DUF1643 domain-containing protein [Oscillospiraceae bacterium]
MHIPKSITTELAVMEFDRALEKALTPGQEYDIDRWLFVPPMYDEYRYILGTRGENPLICIGINPSTARPGDLDNTLKSVERIALGNGYDSFIMFNVYAQRATRPEDMEQQCNALLHQENMKAFAYVLDLYGKGHRPAVWAAWGTIIEKRPYLAHCLSDMIKIGQEKGARWFSCGNRSKKGHPHHPLYLRKDAVPEPFDAGAYLESLLKS